MLTLIKNPCFITGGCLLFLNFLPEFLLLYWCIPYHTVVIHSMIKRFLKFRKFHPREFSELVTCFQFRDWNSNTGKEVFIRMTRLLKECFHNGFNASFLLSFYLKLRDFTFICTGIRKCLYQIAIRQISRNTPKESVYYETRANQENDVKDNTILWIIPAYSAVLVRPKSSSDQKQSPSENEDCGVVGKETFHRCPEKHQKCSDQNKSMIPVLYAKANSGKLYTHKDSPLSCLYYEYTTPNTNVNSSSEASK